MIRRPPRSTPLYSSAASDVYKRQRENRVMSDLGERRQLGKWMVKTKSFFRSLLYVAVAVLIGATYLSMGRSIGGGDWNGKPTEADLRGAARTFVLPSGFPPADVQMLQKVTFLAVVFDAELESDPEQVAAFFLKQAAENKWQVKMDRQQTEYRLSLIHI